MLTTDTKQHTSAIKEIASPARGRTLQSRSVNRTGMPDHLKNGIEHLSGLRMDHVRVHYNSSKPAQLQALAYAQGTDIHIAPGQERHLPHEAWHVVQQMQGRVRPTMQLGNTAINDNPALEREADIMGDTALHGKMLSRPAQLRRMNGAPCVQRRPNDLYCEASIHYDNGSSTQAMGYNKAATAKKVLSVFEDHGLTNLAAVPRVTNAPGACAEPHAVANALEKEESGAKITGIHISPAWFTPKCIERFSAKELRQTELGIPDENFAKVFFAENPIPKNESDIKTLKEIKCSYPPCATCAQWIETDGRVKSAYLQ